MIKYIITGIAIIGYILISILIKNQKIKNPLKWIFLLIFLEATLFNINSYRMDFKNYERKEISLESAKVFLNEGNNPYEDIYFFPGESKDNLILENIDTEIATMKFEFETKDVYDVVIGFTDDTLKDFKHNFSKEVDNSYERSKYIPCYFSGETNKLNITFDSYTYLDISKSKIILNEEIPFEFNYFRFGLILLIGLFLYFCKYSKTMNSCGFKENFIIKVIVLFWITVLFILMNWWFSFKTCTGDTSVYTHNFVDALLNKQVHLIDEPTEKITNLENPYDPSLRKEIAATGNGKSDEETYLWDTALYENKYYVYFGILPALELLVPYKIVTGNYMLSENLILIYSIITIIGLVFLSLEILEKWFKDIPFKMWTYFIIFVLFGSMVLWTNGRPTFYEIPVIAAMAHSIWGAILIFKSYRRTRLSYTKLFFGSLLLAASVACRPTFLLVSLIWLPYFIKLIINKIKEKNISGCIKLFISVGLPYLTIGISLMLYNYVRFGNILEFGANYQLTVADISNLKYRFQVIPIGIETLLFKIPTIMAEFPYFEHYTEHLKFYGFYYTENLICGYLFIAPITFLLFGIKNILREVEQKDMKKFLYLSLIIALIIAVLSIYMAGSLQRYVMDYAWILCIVASCLMLQIYRNIDKDEKKETYIKIVQKVLIISMILGTLICGIIGESSNFRKFSSTDYYKIRYTFCFWE